MKNARGRTFGTHLTQRQFDVLLLLADGDTVQEISEQMEVKRDTVDVFVAQMRGKLGAKTTTHAVAIAYRIGLLTVG